MTGSMRGAGAFGFAWLDDYIGSKPTILIGVFAIALLGLALLPAMPVFHAQAQTVGLLGQGLAQHRDLRAHGVGKGDRMIADG